MQKSHTPGPIKGWIFYDGRAAFMDEDDSAVLEACETERDYQRALKTWADTDAVVFEYDATCDEWSNGRNIGTAADLARALP